MAVACSGIMLSGCSHVSRHDRFFATAFIAYLGPFQGRFTARAIVDVPKTSLQRSSPSIQFQIVEGNAVIEGGLIRRLPRSELMAFATDVAARRRKFRMLGPVGDGPHTISIRGNEGLTKFLVDGKVEYTFGARFAMDRDSSVMIGTLVSYPGDRPAGTISNLFVTANGRDLGMPS